MTNYSFGPTAKRVFRNTIAKVCLILFKLVGISVDFFLICSQICSVVWAGYGLNILILRIKQRIYTVMHTNVLQFMRKRGDISTPTRSVGVFDPLLIKNQVTVCSSTGFQPRMAFQPSLSSETPFINAIIIIFVLHIPNLW